MNIRGEFWGLFHRPSDGADNVQRCRCRFLFRCRQAIQLARLLWRKRPISCAREQSKMLTSLSLLQRRFFYLLLLLFYVLLCEVLCFYPSSSTWAHIRTWSFEIFFFSFFLPWFLLTKSHVFSSHFLRIFFFNYIPGSHDLLARQSPHQKLCFSLFFLFFLRANLPFAWPKHDGHDIHRTSAFLIVNLIKGVRCALQRQDW